MGLKPDKEGLKQTCVKNSEDAQVVPDLKLVNWPTAISWMLAEATRFLWQRQRALLLPEEQLTENPHLFQLSKSPIPHGDTKKQRYYLYT